MPDATTLDIDLSTLQPNPPPTTAGPLLAALRRHYIGPDPLPGGVFLTEVQVPDAHTVRRADAVYLSFTRAHGIGIDVCEVKVTHSDFVRELTNPVKAEAWWKYSTRWWIVSPSPTVTPVEELPDGWGLMCPSNRGRRFKVHRPAAVRQPQVDLTLLIEIAKRMDTIRANEVRQVKHETEWEWQKLSALRAEQEERAIALTPAQQKRLDMIAEIERLAGVTLTADGGWYGRHLTPERFATILRAAADVTVADREVERLLDHLDREGTALTNVAAKVNAQLQLVRTAHSALAAARGPAVEEQP